MHKTVSAWVALASLGFASSVEAQSPQLVKKWETAAALKTPESVCFDAQARVLYVSNIDGEPWAKDGKGSIGKVDLDGKVIAAEWVKGLHAPKGMGLHAGRLFVADMDGVAIIDVAKGALVETIAIAGAQQLNDITIDAQGAVYVSDSKTGTIHVLKEGKASVWLEKLGGLNGLLAHGEAFYALANGAMHRVGKDKSLTKIVDGLQGGADGIEHVSGSEFVVSCWRGTVYHVDASKGEKHTLLDTSAQKIQSADIGYDAKNRIVYVPTFFTNTVVAYELK